MSPRPVSLDADRCLQCGAPVFYAIVPTEDGQRWEVALDVTPTATGPLWVDERGRAQSVAVLYVDGEPRYTPHARVCPAIRALLGESA